ncbi:hypothetical protein FZEAL_936 [Fusarium zealandicum]|uniref:Heterokaryon incompatibility domain-containing protein n=1 Tax=Fusarium zealandicum TaxID=1053134 RepID=A0A8H4XPU2_9HYPO|nr:hypothetical protein FZEAL_936 [Fusarium zealandicum]
MLRSCEAGEGGHDRCFCRQNPVPLPTRVLQVNPDDDHLRLYESEPGETGAYAALSHCWGPLEKRPARTTDENLSRMRSSISWSELSAVFKDAIWLCKQLGINYLWIDSLCIIQGNSADWQIESAKMAEYYSGAHLTIAVESAPDGTEPFLRESKERWQPMVYSTSDEAGSPFTYIVQEHFGIQAFAEWPYDYYQDGCRLHPTRAWTLQESLLSTRLVRFTPSDIIWECYSDSACQDVHRDLGTGDWNARRPFFALNHLQETDEQRREAAYNLWKSLVLVYSQRVCTFVKDRLPAFSGVASQFAKFFPGRYLAGIWEVHLPRGLCWSRRLGLSTSFSSRTQHLALEENVAPSWSWASLPPGVPVESPAIVTEYTELDLSLRPRILEVSCDAPENAPFGQVTNGYLLMEAPLFEVTITCTRTSPKKTTLLQYHISFGHDIGGDQRMEFKEDSSLAMENGNALRATRDCQVEYRQDPSTFHARAWVVWITGSEKECMSGLVLGQREDSAEYQRLGYLTLEKIPDGAFSGDPPRSQIRLI